MIKLAIEEKRIHSVFWAVLLLNHMLLISVVCEPSQGLGYISFASNRGGDFNIYIMDTNSENISNLTDDPARELEPAWSPDGHFLAYVSNRDGDSKIYVMNAKTREHRRLTHRHERERSPAWSPDGKWIAFVSGSFENPPFGKITSHIYKTDVNGVHLVQLTDQGKNLQPAWSPDSKQIAFVSYDRGERKGLYVMNANGRRLRRLTDQKVQALKGIFQGECAWSPDGKQIAFSIVVRADNRMHLCVIDRDGKNFRQLTRGGPIVRAKEAEKFRLPIPFPLPEIGSPAWSSNGKSIAYLYSDTVFGGTADIYIIDVEGNGRGKPLVEGTGQDMSPAWVPEGFLSVSPSTEKQTTVWGRLKQEAD